MWRRFCRCGVWLVVGFALTACGADQAVPTDRVVVEEGGAGEVEETAVTQTEVIMTDIETEPETNANELVERIETYLNALAQQGSRGSVLVDKGGEVLLSAGYGLADDSGEIQNTPQTVFDVGSITKQFTGAAILKLQDEGRLSVDDTLGTYLPELPAEKQAITLHQLLTHTAGLPDALGDDYEAIDRDAFIDRVARASLLHESGGGYAYSNVGYSLLTIVIELITDDSYEVYLREALFLPAGMENTGYVLPEWDEANIAVGYRGPIAWGKPNEKRWADDGPYWHLRGNGGILSSAEDMYRWHQALLSDNILSAVAKAQFYTPHTSEGEGSGTFYGYGWALFPTPRDTMVVTHNGGNGIFFADFWRFLEEDVTVYFATNAANQQFELVAENIVRIIFNPDFVPVVRDEANVNAVELAELGATAAGETVQALLETIREGDEATIQSLIETRFGPALLEVGSIDELIGLFVEFQMETAVLTPATITKNEGRYRIDFVDEAGHSQLTLIVTIDLETPSMIQGIEVED